MDESRVADDGLADPDRYNPRMAFIENITPSEARGQLAQLYKRLGNRDGTVDNVLQAHSLSPESLEAHGALYVQALHRPSPLSRVEREIIAVAVSRVNACHY